MQRDRLYFQKCLFKYFVNRELFCTLGVIKIVYMETLSQIMKRLSLEGYVGNNPNDELKLLNPSDWIIDEIHRFEGNTNPEDNSILYAISKRDHSLKTMLVNSYGVDSDQKVHDFIKNLNLEKV
jgi:hypothetical protein